jgi:hypothetical protein
MVTVRIEHVKGKGKVIVVTVHAMTAYTGCRGIAPLILNLGQ